MDICLVCCVLFVFLSTLQENGITARKFHQQWKKSDELTELTDNQADVVRSEETQETQVASKEFHKKDVLQKRSIISGSKWCGTGNTADDYNDLGDFYELDKCCRTHDHCPRNLLAQQTDYGVTNSGFVTLSDCQCDEVFKTCLKDVKFSWRRFGEIGVAYTVGTTYFNVVKMKCLSFNSSGNAEIASNTNY